VFDHRASAEIGEHLARKPCRTVSSWDEDDDAK